jgi:DNA segregation ATPase FtsK/SpoIIIE, S-DNA-T family
MSVKSNRLRGENLERERDKKKKKSGGGIVHSVKSFFLFFGDERFHKSVGLFLLLLSVYLLIALTSFLFTGNHDQSQVRLSFEEFFSADVRVDNWLGKLGALTAHFIINDLFGLPSFLLVLISFVLGFRILFNVSLLPISKTLKFSFFALLVLSVTFAFIVRQSEYLFLGGAFGYHSRIWLESLIGIVGTAFLLFFVYAGFLLVAFDISLQNLFTSASSVTVPATIIENTNDQAHAIPAPESEADDPELEIEMEAGPLEEELKEDEPELDFSLKPEDLTIPELLTPKLVDPPVKEVEPGSGKDIELDIEETPEEELTTDDVVVTGPEGEYDPKLDLSSYQFPTLDLLENYSGTKNLLNKEEIKAELEDNKNRIVETLGHYNISIDKIKATIGPTVTLFEIVPSAGIRISKIKNLEDDIALSLSALGIRIIAPIPGRGTIGIEVPNQKPEIVAMRSILASEKFQTCEMDLPIALGKTISNDVYVTDLAKMPHMLMAGATGQGKSVGLNAVLVSLLYKKHPSQVKFVLVDPKKVELTLFKKIERHFLAKLPGEEDAIITDTKKVVNTLNSLCIEMDERYDLLKDAQVRNIKEYNAKFVSRRLNPNNGHRFMPYIILVVDEFADLIMTAGKEIETPIARLAQLARAIGIHLIIATQRPSVNIITGTIKANFPARIGFRVSSKIDSRTILDAGGADQLIGRGDMLLSTGADLIRLQCAFVDTPEVDRITEFIGNQRGYPDAFILPEYIDPNSSGSSDPLATGDRDELFEEAARIVVQHQQGSASLLQRRLKLGYNRAGRIVDQLEATGIIGPFEGSKAREVLYKDPMSLEQFLNSLKQSI